MHGNILIAFIAMILAAFCFFIAANPEWSSRVTFQSLGFAFAAVSAAALIWR
jgi:hypothetical protein